MFRKKGNYRNLLYVLGDVWMPVFAIEKAGKIVLVDGVVSYMYPKIKEELKFLGFKPDFQLLTHSHFDHVGVVPFLKEDYPHMKVVASERTAQVLQKPKAIELIRNLQRDAEKSAGVKFKEEFKPFEVDLVVKEGDELLGGKIKVIETPGHTRCSLSFYLPQEKVLFVGDALGVVEEDGYIRPQFLSDYRSYLNSINKLFDFLPSHIVFGHGGIVPLEESERLLHLIKERTEEFAQQIKQLYERYGDAEKVFQHIYEEEYVGRGLNQPEQSYSINLKAMIKSVLRAEGLES